MAKEAFETWDPKPESVRRLQQIAQVLVEYKRMGIKLTLRQLFYQLVSRNIIANTQREYKNLGNLLSKARLAGLIDWDIIEDRVRQVEEAPEWDSIQDLVKSALLAFRLPRWKDQPFYVELWCEKDALSSVLEPICRQMHVPFMVNRGYSSSSAMYESSKRIESARGDREATIIYLGDFDPSGEDMVRDIRDRMTTFQTTVSVEKLALNIEQVRRYKLPPNPLKTDGAGRLTDSRGSGFAAEHGHQSYEVDALPPEVLQKMVRDALMDRMDLELYEEVKLEEERLKETLVKAAKKIK